MLCVVSIITQINVVNNMLTKSCSIEQINIGGADSLSNTESFFFYRVCDLCRKFIENNHAYFCGVIPFYLLFSH